MKKKISRGIACFLAVLFLCSLASCAGGQKAAPSEALAFSAEQVSYAYTLKAASEAVPVALTEESLQTFLETIDGIRMDYPYSEFYGTDLLYDVLNIQSDVKEHSYSVLDETGALTAAGLSAVVEQNSTAFLAEETETALTKPTAAVRDAVCFLIEETVAQTAAMVPQTDLARISCNLGRLCLFVNDWQETYVTLNDSMVMCLSPAAAEAVAGGEAASAVRDALMMEIMHIIQLGCICETEEGLVRRMGVSYRFGNAEQNGIDWPWFYDGAAALVIRRLTGSLPAGYASMASYVRTLDLVSFVQDPIAANAAEAVAFADDPTRLFGLFSCENTEDQFEIANMMRAIDIIQNTPADFFTVYCDSFDLDPGDGSVAADLHYRLRPAICLTLSRVFYKNLAQTVLAHPEMTESDLYCLINLFEQALDYHLGLTKNTMVAVKAPFLVQYRMMRTAFFDALVDSGSTAGLDGYFEYQYLAGEKELNASLSWMDAEKQNLVRERAAFLENENGYQIPEPETDVIA